MITVTHTHIWPNLKIVPNKWSHEVSGVTGVIVIINQNFLIGTVKSSCVHCSLSHYNYIYSQPVYIALNNRRFKLELFMYMLCIHIALGTRSQNYIESLKL